MDDHHDTAVLWSRILSADGHEVHHAESYQAGMDVVRRIPIDVLLSDIQLPDGDGCDLLAEVRTLLPQMQGIALTGHGMSHHLDRYARAGFWRTLVKPAALGDLRAAIAELARFIVMGDGEAQSAGKEQSE